MPLIVRDLSVIAPAGEGRRTVLEGIHFTLYPGEVLGLIGGPGSGKTVLLAALAGIVRPARGSVQTDNPAGAEKGTTPLAALLERPEDMFVSAEAWREVDLGLALRGVSETQRSAVVEEVLGRVGLTPQRFRHRDPRTLSTGEQRRLALASVLALRPRHLVLDEPTAGLDAVGVDILHQLIHDLKATGMGMIILSREADFSLRVADRIGVLKSGRLVAECPASDAAGLFRCLAVGGIGPPDILALWQSLRERGRINEDTPMDLRKMAECLTPEGGLEG